MRENEKQKLENKQIIENTYLRNLATIDFICTHEISKSKMFEISEDDIRKTFSYFVKIGTSQSQLDKNYDLIKSTFNFCKLDTMNNVKRTEFVSEIEQKEVIAFTVEEEKKILDMCHSTFYLINKKFFL